MICCTYCIISGAFYRYAVFIAFYAVSFSFYEVLILLCPCDGLASHPGGSRNTPSRFMLQKPGISTGLMGHCGS